MSMVGPLEQKLRFTRKKIDATTRRYDANRAVTELLASELKCLKGQEKRLEEAIAVVRANVTPAIVKKPQ